MKLVATLLKGAFALAGFGRRKRKPAPHEKPRRRGFARRAFVFTGSAAMVLGASLVGVGLYDYFSDSEPGAESAPAVLSHRFDPGGVYDRPVGVVESSPAPSPTAAAASPTPSTTPAPAVAAAPPPPLRDQPYNMVIEKIGVNAGVFTYGLDANAIPEVPSNGWDVAWYNFSAAPGTGSNAVFAAHVTWNGPAVFYNLDALVPGDEIKLNGTDGTSVKYRVTQSFLVDPADPAALEVMYGTDEDMITIITCGGSPFYVGGSAGYDYTHRLVVRGELVEVHNA